MHREGEQKQNTTGVFFNGFVLGVLVGVGIVLLLTTKKGKRILKTLSEDGLEKVTDIEGLMKKFSEATERAVEGIEENTPGPVRTEPVLLAKEASEEAPEKKTVSMPAIHINTTGEEKEHQAPIDEASFHKEASKDVDDDEFKDESVTKVKPTRRRFFRGIPKRG